MSILRAQINFPKDSQLPEDAVVNRLHFESFTTPATSAEMTAILARIASFFQAVDGFLSPNLASPAEVRLYDMADPEPRIPKASSTFTVTPSTSDPFPSEVALVMSFQAVAVAGTPQARRRNRIFLGPVAGNAAVVIDGISRPSTGFRSAIQAAALAMLPGATVGDGFRWVIRSETTAAIAPVDNGWVDDSWDSQRRRGEAPTSRTTF